MNSTELREQRAKLISQARVIIDAADERDLTAEEQAQVDGMFQQADALQEQASNAERKERLTAAEAELKASQGRRAVPGKMAATQEVTDYDRKAALRCWALAGTGRNNASVENDLANKGLLHRGASLEIRALSKGTATAGGHTVPVGFQAEIEKQLKFYSELRSVAKVLTTDTGADLDYPRVSDIANVASIVGEAGSIATNVDPTFDKVTFKAWKWASPTVLVSLELLQDAAIDIEALLADLLAERMARGQEAAFVTGNGTSTAQGLATGATVGANLATGNAITFDKVFDLVHSVDRAYRQNGAFLMHDTTLAALRKLKDTTGQYIWQSAVTAGEPDTILGYPVYVSNQLTDFGTPGDNQPLVLFGDMSRYMIRDVGPSLTVAKLDQLYMATGQIGFVLLMRTDGRYIGHAGCVKSLNSFDS